MGVSYTLPISLFFLIISYVDFVINNKIKKNNKNIIIIQIYLEVIWLWILFIKSQPKFSCNIGI